MTTMILGRPRPAEPGFAETVRAERIKLTTLRSTWWTLATLVVAGAAGTILLTGLNAEWLASPEADESPGSFITGGLQFSAICAIVLGTLVATTEYGTGMIRSTLAATPVRGQVMAAKAVVVTSVLFVAGTATALIGYAGGNYFLDREGIGLSLEGDVARSMYGYGLCLAGLGLLSLGAGFVLRSTAVTLSLILATMFVLTNLALLIPGEAGEWVVKMMPGNAVSSIGTPVAFNPELLGAWAGFGVFMAEATAVTLVGWYLLRRRDA